jgi:5-formyltetrahydrofolate cyclo-ligase
MSPDPGSSAPLVDIERGKAALRAKLGAARRNLPSDFSASASRRVCDIVTSRPEFSSARSIALYAAAGGELSVRGIFDAAVLSGKCCLLPRCDPDGGLVFAQAESWQSLRPGRFGILEPDPGQEARLLGPGDLAILPGLAFDRNGGRLGRGKGYYDRAFPAGTNGGCILFGVAFSLQLVDEVPMGSWDRRVDAVVTELGAVECPLLGS